MIPAELLRVTKSHEKFIVDFYRNIGYNVPCMCIVKEL